MGGGRSPVPDKEVSVSREWHRRVLPQGNRFPEVLAQLSHHQLLHGAGDGRALEIQKVTRVGHVQDGPRPAATEVGPGGTRRGAGRLWLPPPPAPRCPGAQQSAAFCAKTHALPRLASPPRPARESSSSGFSRQLAGPTATEPAGENSPPAESYLCRYIKPGAAASCSLPSVLPTQAGPSATRKRRRSRHRRSSGKMVPCSRSSSAAASVTEEQRRPDPPHHTHTRALPAPAGGRQLGSGRQGYGRLDCLLKAAFNVHAASD